MKIVIVYVVTLFLKSLSFPIQKVAFLNRNLDTTCVQSHLFCLDKSLTHSPLSSPKVKQFGNLVRRICKSAAITSTGLCLLFSPLKTLADDKSLLNEVWGIVNENFVDSSYNGNDWQIVKQDYSQRLSAGGNEQELIKNMLSKLGDKYSRLIDKKYFESLWKFDAIGIGLIFQSAPGTPMVVSANPIPGSSSEQAGFRKGDIIYGINGRPTEKMTAMDVLDMMSTDESNSVTVTYSHVDETNAPHRDITLTRSKQKAVNPVSYFSQKTSDGTVAGYIRLKEFNSEAVAEVRNAIVQLESEGVQEYILDLRGNTGGGFQFALNIGGLFMDNKPMVTALGKQNDRMVFRSSYPNGVVTTKPLVLWVDGLSASASEVLAGGLHDNCRAALVGSKTFGKGKIQAVFGLSDGEGLTLTVAQYVTPRGTVIQSKGLQPDISVESMSPYIKMLVDPVLSRPDVSKIDFPAVNSLLKSCRVDYTDEPVV